MPYVFGKITERVRARVDRTRNTSFNSCRDGVICYGVPLLPEQADKLDRAGEKLAALIGFPKWLTGVAPIFDGNHAYIEVGALPGSTVPLLPATVDGFPVVVRFGEVIPYGAR